MVLSPLRLRKCPDWAVCSMFTNVSLLLPAALSVTLDHALHFPGPTRKYVFTFAWASLLFHLRRAWAEPNDTTHDDGLCPRSAGFPTGSFNDHIKIQNCWWLHSLHNENVFREGDIERIWTMCPGSLPGDLRGLGLLWRMAVATHHRCIASLFSAVAHYGDMKKHGRGQGVSPAPTACGYNWRKH